VNGNRRARRGRIVVMAAEVKTNHHPRRWRRIKPTGRLASIGKLLVDEPATVVDCNIVDYAAGGACIDLDFDAARRLPPRFVLLHLGRKVRCRVVWRHGRRVGVLF